jgi:hypothetical protein
MNNCEELIIAFLDPLIKFGLLELSIDKKINNKYDPLFKILRVYKNLLDNTEIGIPERCKNIDMWNFIISNRISINYILDYDLQKILLIVMKYNEKHQSDFEKNKYVIRKFC